MKTFIISENPANGIVVSNVLNKLGHNVVISEEDATDSRALLSELTSNISAYDIIFVLSKSPRLLEMQVNKMQKVMASVCKDEEDAEEIAGSNVNVIILSSGMSKADYESILNIILNKPFDSTNKNIRANINNQNIQKSQDQKINKKISNILNLKTNTLDNANTKQKEKQNADIIKEIKSKGFSKFLKDSLGIEDEQ
ncbi:MAG: hypothetical protein ACP5RI_01235 [Candidatus Micrarchaeia archaeon]